MAIFGNFKGTTKSEFQIGKSGSKVSSGSAVPSTDLSNGDLFIDAANSTLQVYNNAWVNIGTTLPELNVDDGTLFVDQANDTVSIGSTSSNEKLFVNGSLRLGTNPSLQHSGAYLDLRHSNGSATQVRVRDNSSGTDPVFKVYNANNTDEVFKVQGANVRIHDAYNMPTADGTANQILQTDGSGTLSFVDNSATPGGANTQIQFNDDGAFGGHANLYFDKSGEVFHAPSINVTTFSYSILSEDYGLVGEEATVTKDFGEIDADANEAYLNNVVEDTTPQLGGNLDLNNNSITGTGDIDITGNIVLPADGTIGSDSAGTFVRFHETSSTYTGKDLSIGSAQSVHVLLDTNADNTNVGGFTVRTGAANVDSSTEIFKVSGTGTVVAKSYKDTVYTITDGASVDIDPDNGGIQVWTLGANRSPTANNFDAGAKVMLMISDGASAYSITWPSVNWVGGVAPTLPTSGYGIVELWKVGSQLYGAYAGGVA